MQMSPSLSRERFARARVARMATVDPSGAPHVVPVTFAVRGDVVVTAVDHKPKSSLRLRRLANIAGEPRVALLADHYSEDWDALWWVRVDGRADVARSGERRSEALSWLSAKYAHYRGREPLGPVIWVQVDRVSGWAAASVADAAPSIDPTTPPDPGPPAR